QIEVVEVAESRHVRAGGLCGLRQDVGDSPPARTHAAPPVARQQIVDAESRTDLRAALRRDVERRILSTDDVGPETRTHRQSCRGPPRVLGIDGVIMAVSPTE